MTVPADAAHATPQVATVAHKRRLKLPSNMV
jgi:hypothetical protein